MVNKIFANADVCVMYMEFQMHSVIRQEKMWKSPSTLVVTGKEV